MEVAEIQGLAQEYLPPLDVLGGFICIFIFGMMTGAVICLPIAHHNSELPLERLSGDLIWRYAPDWILLLVGCIFFLVVSFILISGIWRM
ncbi:MAG: hypothetical protein J5809_01230 [Selenomonadaceae bacterium]|nr:hypothetical protein [Selenomonadaceae bacterium]